MGQTLVYLHALHSPLAHFITTLGMSLGFTRFRSYKCLAMLHAMPVLQLLGLSKSELRPHSLLYQTQSLHYQLWTTLLYASIRALILMPWYLLAAKLLIYRNEIQMVCDSH